jgi:N-acetylglucosaminyldiphosphoundecaprenol N-acetyl-beta-D-mannosaminyltransferase
MVAYVRRTTLPVLGADIDIVDWDECLTRIGTWAEQRDSRYVCLCNVHSVVTARREPRFASVINAADLAAPDGAPVAWRLRSLGCRGQQRIAGPDLMWRCCELAAERGLSVFLLGGTQDILGRLTARLRDAFPELRIAGSCAPPYRRLAPQEDARIVHAIERSGAHLVFVALGCPNQEIWMAAHRGRLRGVMVGIGAAFDFHAGMIPRAPSWMQAAGLEWLHRLCHEPRRLWRRYLVTNTLFCLFVLSELWGSRRATEDTAEHR